MTIEVHRRRKKISNLSGILTERTELCIYCLSVYVCSILIFLRTFGTSMAQRTERRYLKLLVLKLVLVHLAYRVHIVDFTSGSISEHFVIQFCLTAVNILFLKFLLRKLCNMGKNQEVFSGWLRGVWCSWIGSRRITVIPGSVPG